MHISIRTFEYILVIIMGLIFFFYIVDVNYDDSCIRQNKFESLSIRGVVENKFIDSTQHSTPIVIVTNFKSNTKDTISLFGDKSYTYELLKRQDTLYKSKSSNRMYVRRNGSLELIGVVDFGCEE